MRNRTATAVITFVIVGLASPAVGAQSPTGNGVVIAILDRGIDWRHPDFITTKGRTRIKGLLDMSNQDLCDGTPATEYTSAQINAALNGGPYIPSDDFVGHGTATAGVAAGNGRAAADGKYKGVAPRASLLIVKMTSEGAPAHGSVPAEAPFQACIDEALEWVDAKLDALGKPAVIIINSGAQWGPIDGTSAVSRKLGELFTNEPGRVVVLPSGDEGGLPNHAGGTYDGAGTEISFVKEDSSTTYMQAWYSGDAPAHVGVTFDNGPSVEVAPESSVDRDEITMYQFAPGGEFYPWTSTGGDRAVWIRMTGHSGSGHVSIRSATGAPGTFDLYSDVSGPNLTSIVSFTDHLVPGRVTDYGSTRSAIIVGNSVARTTYRDVDGVVRTLDDEGLVGDLWTKSSGGPTRDGRRAIDIVAPGQNVFAAVGRRSYWRTLRFNLVNDGRGWYVRFGGTSGALPIVAGVVARMLELDPSLTTEDVRAILHDTAVTDGKTGPTPNNDWGYGKLNAKAAVERVATS